MDINQSFSKLKHSLKAFYDKADDFSGGVLEIMRVAFMRFSEERGPEASASLAYYALFSIFPILLVIITVGSFFVDRGVLQQQLLDMLQGVVPGAEELVIGNIDQVLESRGAVTFVALVSLIWSSTGVFNILAKHINRAFPKATVPDFFKGRLMGFFMFVALGLLILLSLAASTLSGLIPVISIPFNDKALHETLFWQVGAFLVPVGLNLLMFWALYFWVPTVKVSQKAALLGGLVAGVAWELLNNAFTWYLSSGFSRYRLVYGSVGMIVALLFWIYMSALITILGAHLTASIQSAKAHKDDEQPS